MSWRDNLKKLSHSQVRAIAALCSGAVLLIAVALVLSGGTAFLPQSFTVALQNEASSQSAAVWWSATTSYSGYTKPPTCYSGYAAQPQCAVGTVALFDAYPTQDSSQLRISYAWGPYSYIRTGNSNPPFSIVTWNTQNAGTPVTVPSGQQVTLEWSCLKTYTMRYPLHCSSYDVFGNCTSANLFNYAYPHFSSGVGTNFNTGSGNPRIGSVTVTPSAPSTTYTLTCKAVGYGGNATCDGSGCPWGWMGGQTPSNAVLSVTVNVGPGLPPPPTATITTNAPLVSGVPTVTVGTPITVTATYTSTGDTLVHTAIDGPTETNGTNCVSSLDCAGNANPKSFTFTPATAGNYTFVPDLWTISFPKWNNNSTNASVTVVAKPVVACPGGQINPPTCTICDPTKHDNGSGVCIANACADPHEVAPLCNTCVSPYVMQSGSCALPPPTLSLALAQSRVQKGAPASLSWSVKNLSGDPTVQCSIASLPSGVFSRVMPAGTTPTWSGSNVATNPINSTSIFTLSCTGATPVSKTVTVVPTFQEI